MNYLHDIGAPRDIRKALIIGKDNQTVSQPKRPFDLNPPLFKASGDFAHHVFTMASVLHDRTAALAPVERTGRAIRRCPAAAQRDQHAMPGKLGGFGLAKQGVQARLFSVGQEVAQDNAVHLQDGLAAKLGTKLLDFTTFRSFEAINVFPA
ncbi:hypothetical protein [Ruegeria sp. HKCCD7559]|uniref:hypothetical protein n=1 Tax=Ruegeria sp. HKCCD7559 TaxID=2683005 RepID=UPI001491ED0C|nr:hypothetical protein [Ruegeria sp. HKCCD7559]NOC45186.1 hypothetical protein [Ruegeria sp. HKCCD7559]